MGERTEARRATTVADLGLRVDHGQKTLLLLLELDELFVAKALTMRFTGAKMHQYPGGLTDPIAGG
jgi:hypothetical protein